VARGRVVWCCRSSLSPYVSPSSPHRGSAPTWAAWSSLELAQHLAAEALQPEDACHRRVEPAPADTGAIQDCPDQRQTGMVARQDSDYVELAPALAESPLQQIGVANALTVLDWDAPDDLTGAYAVTENLRSVQGGFQAIGERHKMGDPESHEVMPAGLTQSARSMVESAIKTAIEQALVAEVVRSPETAMSFDRVFNRDAPDFSRIFSRGGTHLADLTIRDVTSMDDAAFAKFTERLRLLQAMGPSESSEGH
jgi:hypothetical protein